MEERAILEPVTVLVATFNSARFVEETLESIYLQTYPSLELIIADDGSEDSTVRIVSEWMVKRGSRFNRVKLLPSEKNTGVSANCNRGIREATSLWIKMIAGDDILLSNCITDNMRFVKSKKDIYVLFSFVRLYRNDFSSGSYVETIPKEVPSHFMGEEITAEEQYRMLLISDRIPFTPSYFFHAQAVASVGYYDERNIYVEDYPMWIKLTKAGYKLHFMSFETVGYRQHALATNNNAEATIFPRSQLKLWVFRRDEVLPLLPWELAGEERWVSGVRRFYEWTGLNSRGRFNLFFYRVATVWVNPFKYLSFFMRKVGIHGGRRGYVL